MDTLDFFAILAIVLGILVIVLNLPYFLKKNHSPLRLYFALKSAAAGYFALLYFLILVDVIPAGTTSPWLRPSAVLLLLFLVLDAVIRRKGHDDN